MLADPAARLGQRGDPRVRHRLARKPDQLSTRPQIGPRLEAPEEAERVARTFDIAPDQLVVAAGPNMPLMVSLGEPAVGCR